MGNSKSKEETPVLQRGPNLQVDHHTSATGTENNAQAMPNSTGLSIQRREILKEMERLDKMERLAKDDSFSQDVIEKERHKMQFLIAVEENRELLSSTVNKFQENLKNMKTARDVLNGIENQPGEVKTFCRAFDDACKDGEETETLLNDLNRRANELFNINFKLQLNASKTVDALAVGSDDLIHELNKLKDMNKTVQLRRKIFEEKTSKLDFETLKTYLKRKEKELKSERLKLIGIGVGASLVAASCVGLVVVMGICLWKYAPDARKLITHPEFKEIGSVISKSAAKVSEYFTELSSNREELKSMEQCLEVLNGLETPELKFDEVLRAVEAMICKAQSCQEQTFRRLKEIQKAIKSDQMELKAKEEEQRRIDAEQKAREEEQRRIDAEQKAREEEQKRKEVEQQLIKLKKELEFASTAQVKDSNNVFKQNCTKEF